jgi:hypothetical protein
MIKPDEPFVNISQSHKLIYQLVGRTSNCKPKLLNYEGRVNR